MAESVASDRTIQIEDAGPCRKRLRITVPANEVDQTIETSLAAVAEEAALPGFRRGRVPRKLLEKRFGQEVRREARGQLVSEAFSKAVEEHGLKVIGDPEPGEGFDDFKLVEGSDASFAIEVEIAPEFDTPDLGAVAVDKPVIEIQDQHVEKQIDYFRKAEGELKPVEQAGPGHYIIGNAKMTCEGEHVLDLNGAVVQIPEAGSDGGGMILGVIVDDLGEQLGTPKAEDTVTIKTVGPANHENETIREKPIEIEFEVTSAQEIVPISVDDLVARLGMPDESQLRNSIELNLNRRSIVEQQSAMRQQAAKQLLEAVDFELPERLSARQAERNIERRRYELLHRGVPQEEVEKQVAEMRGASGDVAQRELKLFFILNQIAQEKEIQVSEDEVRGRIAQIAAEQRVPPQEMLQRLQGGNRIGLIVQQIREHKAMDAILAQASVTELPVDEYNKKVRGEDSLTQVEPAGA